MPTFSPLELRQITSNIFVACGTPEDEADVVSRILVEANLVGLDSHGVIRIPQYVDYIRDNWIEPGAPVTVIQETGTTAIVDGGWNFGPVVASRAVEIGIAKAKENGIASVVTRRSNHVGRLGAYPQMIAEQGLIGMAVVNTLGGSRYVPPWGGREPRLSTNPISFAVPTGKEPVVIDMTTSATAEGKVRVKRNRGESVPDGWIVDSEGNPSNDPNDFYGPPSGMILPLGADLGYKGYALGLMVDILGGVLSGAGYVGEDKTRIGNGMWMLVQDVKAFAEPTVFQTQIDDLLRFVRSAKPAPGFNEVMVPGEPEFREKAKREREGIFVEDETWGLISVAAQELGVEF